MTQDELAEYLRWKRPQTLETISRVRRERLTFLSERKLIELAGETALLAENGIGGAVVEAGCALGGSALVLAAAKEPERPLYLYDMFGMIPLPGLRDGLKAWRLTVLNRLGLRKGHGGDKYYGYESDLLEKLVSPLHGRDVHALGIGSSSSAHPRERRCTPLALRDPAHLGASLSPKAC